MLELFNNLIWGEGTLGLILVCGVIILIRCRGVQFCKLLQALSLPFSTDKSKKALSSFAALATALAGTMGVGNIVGVGTALALGGPGAIFWMWISAFLGMGIKYAEIFLAVKFKDQRSFGAMGYIKNGLKCPPLAACFAVLTAISSLGIGNCVQIGAVKTSFDSLGISHPWLLTILILIPFALIILKGDNAVSKSAEKIIPVISAVYIAGCVGIIVMHLNVLPSILKAIFMDAFGLRATAAGTAGYAIKECLRVGVSQGVFSNEAGMGSSCIVLSMTDESSCRKQGLWGIFEVFFDTIVICTLTALSILCSGINISDHDPGNVTYAAFANCYPKVGGIFITVSVAIFAMATLICWSFYGTQALKHLSAGRKSVIIYKVIFVLTAVLSVFFEFTTLYIVSDILNGLMLLVNVPILIIMNRHLKIDTGTQVEYNNRIPKQGID